MKHHHLESVYPRYLRNKDIAKNSRKLYGIVLKQYMSFLITNDIQFAKTSHILRYKQQLKEDGFSMSWIYIQMSVVKGFYRYLRANHKQLDLSEVYANDITEEIRNPHPKMRMRRQMLTIEQAKKLIVSTRKNRKYIWHYRNHAILFLMLTTGLRSIEVRRAKRKDFIMQKGQWILYVQGKGRLEADEFVKVTPSVTQAIHDYLEKREDNNPYLFIPHSNRSKKGNLSRSFFKKMFADTLKDCGIKQAGLTPHVMRHAAATFNLLRGGSLESTRKLLRHKSIDTTLIYAHHIDKMKDDSSKQIEQFILKEEYLPEELKSLILIEY
ncbi:MAG: tyrosine-type recombinase/integrase [Candidatus Izimaplasma sp.]|nr:tyrosine-type recombinase/integrase [Candidatus Izimaplasma bacterium]